MHGDSDTTERNLYIQINIWSFSIWHVKLKEMSFGK